jgi:hypothetical protein
MFSYVCFILSQLTVSSVQFSQIPCCFARARATAFGLFISNGKLDGIDGFYMLAGLNEEVFQYASFNSAGVRFNSSLI